MLTSNILDICGVIPFVSTAVGIGEVIYHGRNYNKIEAKIQNIANTYEKNVSEVKQAIEKKGDLSKEMLKLSSIIEQTQNTMSTIKQFADDPNNNRTIAVFIQCDKLVDREIDALKIDKLNDKLRDLSDQMDQCDAQLNLLHQKQIVLLIDKDENIKLVKQYRKEQEQADNGRISGIVRSTWIGGIAIFVIKTCSRRHNA